MPRNGIQRAAQAHGELTTAAQQLYLGHCYAAGGDPQHSAEELAHLRERVKAAAEELIAACDAEPLDLNELDPE